MMLHQVDLLPHNSGQVLHQLGERERRETKIAVKVGLLGRINMYCMCLSTFLLPELEADQSLNCNLDHHHSQKDEVSVDSTKHISFTVNLSSIDLIEYLE